MSRIVLLALGSNLGNRIQNIREALKRISIHNRRYSFVYESMALLPKGCPPHWNMPFLNMVVAGYTHLEPLDLLQHLQDLEEKLGGRRNKELWSPRALDIDIALWEETIIDYKILTIPHKAMHKRNFVLIPTCDICPRLLHPILNITLESILLGTLGTHEDIAKSPHHISTAHPL